MVESHRSAGSEFLKHPFRPIPVSAKDSLFQTLLLHNDGVTLSIPVT
jgi:hypothetical protein